MPREQHSAQQGGDVSPAVLDVHILLPASLFPFGFLSSVASQMQAERIDCKENPIQAFNKRLFMLDRVVALSAA